MVDEATVQASAFRGVIEFFERLGIYDVVLPFLLVFTIMYAVLEKTALFGHEDMQGTQVTKKNLNAMVAFVISFFVIASSKLVAIINESMSNIVILVLVVISFLLLVGIFYKESEEVALEGSWRTFFMIIMFIGVVLIFAHAIPYEGQPFLNWVWGFVMSNYNSTAVSSLIMFLIILGLIVYVTKDPKPKPSKSDAK